MLVDRACQKQPTAAPTLGILFGGQAGTGYVQGRSVRHPVTPVMHVQHLDVRQYGACSFKRFRVFAHPILGALFRPLLSHAPSSFYDAASPLLHLQFSKYKKKKNCHKSLEMLSQCNKGTLSRAIFHYGQVPTEKQKFQKDNKHHGQSRSTSHPRQFMHLRCSSGACSLCSSRISRLHHSGAGGQTEELVLLNFMYTKYIQQRRVKLFWGCNCHHHHPPPLLPPPGHLPPSLGLSCNSPSSPAAAAAANLPGTTVHRSTPFAETTHSRMTPPEAPSRLTAISSALCTCETHSSLQYKKAHIIYKVHILTAVKIN